MSLGLSAGLRAEPRIYFAADEASGPSNLPRPQTASENPAAPDAVIDEQSSDPLTSRAEILGNALNTLGTTPAGTSPHWRFGRPRTLDFVPPGAERPLGSSAANDLGDTLSPMIARYLGDSDPAPVQPLVQPPGSGTWTGSPTEFVFARVRRRRLNESPPPVQPSYLPNVQRTPAEALSSGDALPGSARQAMEPIIGTNLGDVRIHTSPAAGAMASALAADAFTVGREVFFAEGKFDPFSPRGQALLAHELVHVRQQERSTERVQRHGDHPDSAEAEAEVVERAVLDRADGSEGQLNVDSYVRRYFTTTGARVPVAQREQLDAISVRALAVAEEILGPDLARHAGRTLDSVDVNLELDISALDSSAAARHWGQALANAIRRALG
ncbi:MAG TPA: DUF4157 domain-containing protein [Chloroflexota bacterium]|nr:DUF4157 domain-containing protein [Chloroflexota bacterium]